MWNLALKKTNNRQLKQVLLGVTSWKMKAEELQVNLFEIFYVCMKIEQ
jgi:hypothetical protein